MDVKYVLLFLTIFTVLCSLSWFCVCVIVKALSICFGFVFTWKLATGIWIVCLLLRWIISAAKSDKK